MADEKVTSVKLRFELDRAAFADVKANTRALQEELARLDRQRAVSQAARDAAQFAAESGNARAAVARLNAELTKLDASTEEVRRAAREFDRLRQAAEDAAKAQQQASGGGFKGMVGRLGSEIRNLPSVPIGGGLTSDVFGRLLFVFGKLNPVILAAVAGIGAFVVGLQSITREAGEAISALIATQKEYYTLLKTGSREQIEDAIRQREVELEIARARREENLRIFQAIEERFSVIGRAIGDAFNLAGLRTLREETQKLEEEIRNNEFALGRLRGLYQSQEVQARELAEAERRLAEQRQRMLDQEADVAIRTRLDVRSVDSMAQLNERVRDLMAEIGIISEVTSSAQLSEDAMRRYNDRMRELTLTVRTLLSPAVQQEVRERERAAEAARRSAEAQKRAEEAARQFEQRMQAVARAQEQAARLELDYQSRLASIEENLKKQLADAAKERAKALANLDREAAKERAQAERDRAKGESDARKKAQDDAVRATQEHQQRLAEIQRRYQLEEAQAIEDRDAVALDRARRQRDENVAQEQARYDEQRARVDAALREQLAAVAQRYAEQTATINARLVEQRDAIQARYAEQVNAARQSAAQQRAAELQAYQQRLADLARSLQQQNNISLQGAMAALGIQRQYWSAVQSLVQQQVDAINQVRQRAQAMALQPASGRALPSGYTRGGTPGFRAFDTGGVITRTGMALVHAGEYILNPRRGQAPVTFAPTVNVRGGVGDIRQVLMQEVERFAAQLERELGY